MTRSRQDQECKMSSLNKKPTNLTDLSKTINFVSDLSEQKTTPFQ